MTLAIGALYGAQAIAADGGTGTPGTIGTPASADDINVADFDPDLLKQRGFDPHLADYLRRAPRYTPGTHQVAVVVNGMRRGKTTADFDAAGGLCFTPALVEFAGLHAAAPTSEPCIDVAKAYPLARVELRPESGEIGLVVPMDDLRPAERNAPSFARGGIGGLLNYEVTGSRSDFNDVSTDHLVANTQLGLNAGNWIIRSAQSYTDSNGTTSFERRETYAQRTLLRMRSELQLGDVTLENAALPGALISGVQLLPEHALSEGASGAIEGIAQTQARVDVRQSGTLIYSTVVPPGPFALANLPLLDRISTLDVTVSEADGSERRFSVPAATLGSAATAIPTGYTLSAGRLRDQGVPDQAQPWVVSASGTWPVKKIGTVSAGALGAQGYGAGGVGAQARWDDWGLGANAQVGFSRDSREDVSGAQLNLAVQQRIAAGVSLSASVQQRTDGYRDLLETVQPLTDTTTRSRSSWSAGIGWGNAQLGTLSAGYTHSSDFQHIATERATLSWGRQVRGVSLSASADWNLDPDNKTNDNAVYFTVSMPLGSTARRMTAGYNRRGDRDRYSVQLDDRLTDTFRYRVGAEHDARNGETDMRADVSMLPHYTQVDLGVTRSTSGDTNARYGARGGMAFHQDGITLSPYPIEESFGLVSIGDASGVKVMTPSGPVWTDFRGKAVISRFTPYASSAIELVPKTLPRNVNVDNGRQEIEVGRGSVQHVIFQVSKARRVLLEAAFADGTMLPSGASVLDANGKLVTLVADNGEIFFTNDPVGESFVVHLPDGGSCVLEFTLPKAPATDDYYETVKATCRPGELDRKKFAISRLTGE